MQSNSGQKMRRRAMGPGDWFNAAAILAIGIFLGIAAHGMMSLAGTDFWPSAVFTVVIFAVLFTGVLTLDKLTDKFFQEGIRPAKKEREAAARPIGLLLSLPFGAVIGFVLAWFDLATPILDILP